MLNAQKNKLESMLSRAVRYTVPNYQRNYEWRRDNADEFWQDIQSPGTFMGTVVFNVSDEDENQIIEVVDGQQRFTTIFILLSALRNRAIEIKSHNQAQVIQQFISFLDNTSGEAKNSKFNASESIRDAFELTIVNQDWLGKNFNIKGLENKKRQVNRIKPVYDFFSEKVSSFKTDDIKNLLVNLYSTTFVEIEIQKTEEAFDIFERTNARGMDLNAADLLKNYLFSKSEIEDVEEKWSIVIENSSGSILRMIKYFYVSKKGYVRKKDLFSKIKNYGEIIGAENFLEELVRFSRLYDLIINKGPEDFVEYGKDYDIKFFQVQYNSEEINRSLDAVNLFGISQSYPIILKMFDHLALVDQDKEKEKESFAKQINQLVNLIEKYHFANSAIAQRPGNEVEKFYSDMCVFDLNEESIKNIIDKVKVNFSEQRVGVNEFTERFKELSYQNDYRLIFYINDRLNNYGLRGSQIIDMYDPDKKVLRRNYDLEHLIAQNSSSYKNVDKEKYEDLIHNIGNLIVISKHTNGGLQNKHIEEKIPYIKQKEKKLSEVDILVEEWKDKKWLSYENIEKNISDRSENMAHRSYKKVWSL